MTIRSTTGGEVLGTPVDSRSNEAIRADIARALDDVRSRTDQLLSGVDDARLHAQHHKLMSPLVWDAGHVGVYEELWLVMNLTGSAAIDEPRMHLYDAFENPRAVRGDLPLMRSREVTAYRDRVRSRVYGILDEIDMHGDDPLTAGGFVYAMVVQHESQHNETLLQALQMLPGGYLPVLPTPPAARPVVLDDVHVPAGSYPIGSNRHEPYDNEHPRHVVALDAFSIDRFPVTCGQYMAFMDAGGYRRRDLWSAEGWRWRGTTGATAPAYWQEDGATWSRDRLGHIGAVDPLLPVMHVSFHEAEAYCRWAHRRLPTEFEWEVAASWDPETNTQQRYPWGDEPPGPHHANLDQVMLGPVPVGSYPAGASALGCEQMLGDVYEWTSSHFGGYPGFRAFPYREYSEVFFGNEYRVLRGASWATRPSVARTTFRNWDYPVRRQIFSGFRTAGDTDTRRLHR